MNKQKIRRLVRNANRRLDLGPNPDLTTIQQWIEATHGRPLTITQLDTIRGDDLCGMCASYQDHILVVHAPPKSSWHLQQIILHEFAHLILGHYLTATSLALTELPGFPDTPLQVFGRTSYEDSAEAAAEMLADLLTARINRHAPGAGNDPAGFDKVFG
ncbi:hypothetical protein QO003_003115 [Arthrobacter silviterrae]|uniref:ImmA/IrrE family metallo-endopeptidase n=1 Tax=Arthrobacter silviterrae TaxID=2026658 RepID=A0ABX0DF52_9MICC|nr:hypothetical protein [Arthrobacter silviterrae]MDQ0278812.1 hypothetical protein [Arthrobacter silviterrae]NGN83980.1 hypothetical protein [Arthrobacter silviterrae]